MLSEIFLGYLLPGCFQGGNLKKKLGIILANQKKNQVSTVEKSGRGGTIEKAGCTLQEIWLDFSGYPSNHFSGCRLNGREYTGWS
jgi:hypothetical protein